MFKAVYMDGFESREDVAREFETELAPHEHILVAWYDVGDYDGSAHVYGWDEQRRQFFGIHGSHCSCYGLEGQGDREYIEQGIKGLLVDAANYERHRFEHYQEFGRALRSAAEWFIANAQR